MFRATVLLLVATVPAVAQDPTVPTVSKDAISIHRVERGNMPLRETVAGLVASLSPTRASVTLTAAQGAIVRSGQRCSVQVAPPTVLSGTVGRIRTVPDGTITAELELAGSWPPGVALRDSLGALIEVGTATDVVFLGRPATARPHTTASIFVIEADGGHAKRVSVRYGRLSGSLIEVVAGLASGDRVIVTDMSAWARHERVRLR